ncbi:exo-alpha-sialidase [uncultured Chitinophaga sp.]|uniref:sialidase family protein n=1 Tax=uncultured Chitinophaga sp. TaxID=339340 RepID=UPI0025E3BB68|nr:sialidase family protein [uncultured Chitinophaga sp.]
MNSTIPLLGNYTLLAAAMFLFTNCKKTTAAEQIIPGTEIAAATAAAQSHSYVKVFDGGNTSGQHSFRIPSIVKTKNGTLIAICECRRWNNSDWGDINVVYKRSSDNGATWSAMGEIAASGDDTWGNPTSVYDPSQGTNGRIWVFMNWHDGTYTAISQVNAWGKRKVFSSYSDDHGVTWSTPLDRTTGLLPPGYTWDAVGPGIGIVTSVNHPGRLIIPAKGRNIYSDNHGSTWTFALSATGSDEGTVVELMDGRLMRNDRAVSSQWELSKRRRVSVGTIEGGFPAFSSDETLLDPKCEASILRYNTDNPHRIVFLNSASTTTRGKMRVRISYDDGQTWPVSRRIYDWLTEAEAQSQGKGGYTSMIKTADYHVGALIEVNEDTGNNETSHRSIEFHKFNLPWMLNGSTEP